jgi:hypothetical protein
MSKPKQPRGIARLIQHQEQFKSAGRLGSLLSFSDLTIHEKDFLSRSLMQLVKLTDEDPHELFAKICFSWGVMCPHPEVKQEFKYTYSKCNACHSLVILYPDHKKIEQVL